MLFLWHMHTDNAHAVQTPYSGMDGSHVLRQADWTGSLLDDLYRRVLLEQARQFACLWIALELSPWRVQYLRGKVGTLQGQ